MGCFPFIKCWLIFSGRKVNTGLYSPVSCRKLAFLGLGAENGKCTDVWFKLLNKLNFIHIFALHFLLSFFQGSCNCQNLVSFTIWENLKWRKTASLLNSNFLGFFPLDANQENSLISRETEVSMVRHTRSQSQTFHNKAWWRLRWWDGKIKATPLIHMQLYCGDDGLARLASNPPTMNHTDPLPEQWVGGVFHFQNCDQPC